MSGKLVGDVIEWRLTPVGAALSETEFIVLFTIADRVLDEKTRRMRRFNGDEYELYERLYRAAGVSAQGLKKVLQRLADRGLDVRVVWKHDKNGDPVYAAKGHAMDFQLPELPASASLPEPGEEGLRACG